MQIEVVGTKWTENFLLKKPLKFTRFYCQDKTSAIKNKQISDP